MIELTRLNGNTIVLNSDLIKTAESSPDTMLTLITGEKLIVCEELDEIVQRVLAYRARLLAMVARDFPGIVSLSGLRFQHDGEVPEEKCANRCDTPAQE